MNTWHEDYWRKADYSPPNVVDVAFREPRPTLAEYCWFWVIVVRALASRLGYAFWLPMAAAVGIVAIGWLLLWGYV